jgi:hypothetical protein
VGEEEAKFGCKGKEEETRKAGKTRDADALTPNVALQTPHRGAHLSLVLISNLTLQTSRDISKESNALILKNGDLVMPTPDIELGPKNVTPGRGFALVASKIASDADKTNTIYRCFDELSARNLLFYQAELAELEEQLKEYDEEDSQARDEASVECQRDWSEFERSAVEGVAREKRRMELVMKIRRSLRNIVRTQKSSQ